MKVEYFSDSKEIYYFGEYQLVLGENETHKCLTDAQNRDLAAQIKSVFSDNLEAILMEGYLEGFNVKFSKVELGRSCNMMTAGSAASAVLKFKVRGVPSINQLKKFGKAVSKYLEFNNEEGHFFIVSGNVEVSLS